MKEITSLDCALCPTVVNPPKDEDWNYYSEEKSLFGLFKDIDYLLKRTADIDCQIIATLKEPTKIEISSFSDERFEFKGFDLIDPQTRISAINNCDGFPKAFTNSKITECGLIYDFARVKEIQKSLKEHYFDEPHAQCDIWVIWRMKQNPR